MIHDPEKNEMNGEQTAVDEAKIRRQQRWKIFGWCVIGLLGALILANFFFFVEPVFNRVGMAVLLVAYLAYVVLRRR